MGMGVGAHKACSRCLQPELLTIWKCLSIVQISANLTFYPFFFQSSMVSDG